MSEPTSLHLLEVRAMAGEVLLMRLPGLPTLSLTRTEAVDLHNRLSTQLQLSEPWIPRPSAWRRLTDWLKRRLDSETRRQERRLRERAERLMNAGVIR